MLQRTVVRLKAFGVEQTSRLLRTINQTKESGKALMHSTGVPQRSLLHNLSALRIYHFSLSAPLLLYYTITEVGIALLPLLLSRPPDHMKVCFFMQKHGLLAQLLPGLESISDQHAFFLLLLKNKCMQVHVIKLHSVPEGWVLGFCLWWRT